MYNIPLPIQDDLHPAVIKVMETPEFKELLRLRELLIRYNRLINNTVPTTDKEELAHRYPHDPLELEFDLRIYREACTKLGLT